MLKVNIWDVATVSFEETGSVPTEIFYEGGDMEVSVVKNLLSLETVSRGHKFNPEADYPGNIQMALNQAFEMSLEITGAIRPPAPEGAQD